MNYEKLGIIATIIIVCATSAFIGVITLDSESVGSQDYKIPQITSSTSTANPNAYYDWCYKMKLDCS